MWDSWEDDALLRTAQAAAAPTAGGTRTCSSLCAPATAGGSNAGAEPGTLHRLVEATDCLRGERRA
ncbi:hypothetical protein [Nonomuraea sp. B10E8]|uniref:hypothetical protein n=1 Tax=Nonomuraea sp. B10E8 TaxID=3153559 RepID=UPI00325F9351